MTPVRIIAAIVVVLLAALFGFATLVGMVAH